MIKSLVFDFDGTIADSMQVVLQIYNSILAPAYHIRPIGKEEEELFRSKDPRSLLRSNGVNIFRLPVLVLRAHKEINKKINEIRPVNQILEILKKLRSSSLTLGVCTSNSQKNVLAFLDENHVPDLFDFIYSGKHLFGKHKLIHKLLKEQKLNKEETLFVGDEIRDVEAAHRAGLKVIAVTWGYNNREALQHADPDFFADTPEEIIGFAT
jgi:HAD superfamily hydrolase (TIGR01509 family)